MRTPHGRIAAALAVLAALAGPVACGSDSGGGRNRLDLQIGVLLPRTGPLQQFGPAGQQATDLATDEIRKAAAKAGARHQLTVTVADDESLPGPALAAAKKIVKEKKASCFVGPWSNGGAERVTGQLAGPKKILVISPAASGDAITQAEDRGYLTRTVPPDRLQAEALTQLMDKKLRGARAKTVNVGALDSTYGNDLTSAFEDAWTGKGGKIGQKVSYRPDQPTFADEVDSLASGKPDAWVFFDFLETFPRIANDLLARNVGFGPRKIFAGDSLATPRLATAAANASQGLRGVAISAPSSGAAAKEFDNRFKARGPAKRQTFDAQAFDATVLCYLSAVAAGSTSGKAMASKVREVSAPPGRKYNWLQLDQAVKALQAGQDIDYDGASGPIDLNDAGDPTAGVYDVYKFKKGKLLIREQIAVPEGKGGI
jgi:branched-chain amino acid transport system substrate-binding protein